MFKYQTYLEKLKTPCPPTDFIKTKREAFRWIFDKKDDNRNFEPVYFKNPSRFNDKTDEERCMAMGLSFFDSLGNAEKRFLKLKKRVGQESYKIFGTQIAKGQIEEEDGVNSLPDMGGHFTHHPSIDFKYSEKLIIVKRLK